jgi:hypothetical protein
MPTTAVRRTLERQAGAGVRLKLKPSHLGGFRR